MGWKPPKIKIPKKLSDLDPSKINWEQLDPSKINWEQVDPSKINWEQADPSKIDWKKLDPSKVFSSGAAAQRKYALAVAKTTNHDSCSDCVTVVNAAIIGAAVAYGVATGDAWTAAGGSAAALASARWACRQIYGDACGGV